METITVVIILLAIIVIGMMLLDERKPKATLTVVGERPVEDLIDELYTRRDKGETIVVISAEDWPEMNSLLFRHHLRLVLIESNIWFDQYENDDIRILKVQTGSKEL